MIAGKDASRHGEAKNSWLTGTAAWNYVAATQHIIGIRADFDGLIISPCIPTSWDRFSVIREFRWIRYLISVENPDHVSAGVKCLVVDGRQVDPGSHIPYDPSMVGRDIPVSVTMGDGCQRLAQGNDL